MLSGFKLQLQVSFFSSDRLNVQLAILLPHKACKDPIFTSIHIVVYLIGWPLHIGFAEYIWIPTDAILSVKDGSLGYKYGRSSPKKELNLMLRPVPWVQLELCF
jgi:hypothetical protein